MATPALTPDRARAILAAVDEPAIVAMARDVVNLCTPTGEELDMARYLRAAWEAMGLRVDWQEVEDDRPNVIATWNGATTGKRLMFNGHMDTSNSGRESFLTGIGYKPHAVVRDGMIYGLGIYNMKGALVCYTQAIKALQSAGVRLAGDLILAGVVGEIEKTQVGREFSGAAYRGYGAGSHYLVTHGVVADMCILGEPTDMQLVLGHYGSLWARIVTRGIYVHTAFAAGRQVETSVRRMHDVMAAIYEWIPSWEKCANYGGRAGTVNVGCIRGGVPWRASRTPAETEVCLDIRVPPTMSMAEARGAIAALIAALQKRYPDYGIDFDTYVSCPGAEISAGHELVQAVEAAHRQVVGHLPKRDTVLWSSDASVLSRYGIPTLNYGPSSGPRDAEGEKVAVETLVQITKVYALAAAEICGIAG
ncbi:MAG TPA: M20/M25/M40 family metallo-hydrolase [Candidatus Acidoferrales bacterium]|nr:M20/M25/M40 family metallo-hydrolase [Candidatus Acidoferrales bacterium]